MPCQSQGELSQSAEVSVADSGCEMGVCLQVDIYSFGIILWELVTLMTPARGNLRSVRVPEECPPDVARLIEDCLEANLPDKRPTASVIYDRLMARCPTMQSHFCHHCRLLSKHWDLLTSISSGAVSPCSVQKHNYLLPKPRPTFGTAVLVQFPMKRRGGAVRSV